MPADSLDEVISKLDEIIEWALAEESRLGFFPTLYREVTLEVKRRIAQGFFEDGERMAKLDVAFANRYFEAFEQHRSGHIPTKSWQVAFESASRTNLLIVQHLFLGINAHINLDLGISAAEIVSPQEIDSFEEDFRKINQLLSEMTDLVQKRINKLSFFFWLLDLAGGRKDEQFADFSLKAARKAAWLMAMEMAATPPDELANKIAKLDLAVAKLAKLILNPGPLVRMAIWLVRLVEKKNVRQILEAIKITA